MNTQIARVTENHVIGVFTLSLQVQRERRCVCEREKGRERVERQGQRGGERGGGERSPSEKEDYPTHISTDITDCPLIILYTKLLISCNSTRHVLLALRWGGGEGSNEIKDK